MKYAIQRRARKETREEDWIIYEYLGGFDEYWLDVYIKDVRKMNQQSSAWEYRLCEVAEIIKPVDLEGAGK